MHRIDKLIARLTAVQEVAFRDLPLSHQLAIVQYMAVDGEAWDILFEDSADAEAVKASLVTAMPAYVQRYGYKKWSVAVIPVDVIKEAVMADEEIAGAFACWDDYAAWYGASGCVPSHGPENRWPVILSGDDYETLADGWHRLHSYIRAGHADIPAVF